ncbi:unnamed protein product, partial [Ostreobium quekettii]
MSSKPGATAAGAAGGDAAAASGSCSVEGLKLPIGQHGEGIVEKTEGAQGRDDASDASSFVGEGPGETAAAPSPKKKKWGIPLSGIIDTLFLGLGGLGVYHTVQQKYIEKRSVEFIVGLVWGAWSGLRFASKYKKNKRRKDRVGNILAVEMGEKGIIAVTQGAPYWLTLEENEKVEWLNAVIEQAWPFYEAAICKQVVATVEPILQKSKPPFISKLFFKKMTFGGVPFKLTHMKTVRVSKREIVLEAGLRWDGTAQVAIGVDLFGTHIAPSITRINFFAQARITLGRLCDKIPGFGVMLVAFQDPPL